MSRSTGACGKNLQSKWFTGALRRAPGQGQEVTARGPVPARRTPLIYQELPGLETSRSALHSLLLLIMLIPYTGFSFFYFRVEETGSTRVSNLLAFTGIGSGCVPGLVDIWLVTTPVVQRATDSYAVVHSFEKAFRGPCRVPESVLIAGSRGLRLIFCS